VVSALSTFNALVDLIVAWIGMDPRMADASMWPRWSLARARPRCFAHFDSGATGSEYSRERFKSPQCAMSSIHYAGYRPAPQSTIIHPNIDHDEIDRMPDHVKTLKPSAGVYTMLWPADRRCSRRRLVPRDDEIGFPFLDRVMHCGGPKIVCAHKVWADRFKRLGQVDVAARHRSGGEGISRRFASSSTTPATNVIPTVRRAARRA